MRVEWYGQSAFRLQGDGATVVIDPFGDVSALAGRVRWEYPAIAGVEADLLLVTHEHVDHNGVEVVGGDPTLVRSRAGRHESPLGDVVGVASEHDEVAGTERGPNTIYAFTLDGVRVAHFGDFGQSALRPEQAAALGQVDLLFVPIGGGPTIGHALAAEIAASVQARWIVPMHYRTHRIDFLEPPDAFAGHFEHVAALDAPRFELSQLADERPLLVLPAAP